MLYAHTTHAMNHYFCMVDCSFVPRPPPSFLSLQQQKAGAVTEGWGSDRRLGQWRKAGAVTEGQGSDRRLGRHLGMRLLDHAWKIQRSYLLISAYSCSLVPWRLLYNDLRIRLASTPIQHSWSTIFPHWYQFQPHTQATFLSSHMAWVWGYTNPMLEWATHEECYGVDMNEQQYLVWCKTLSQSVKWTWKQGL